VELREGNVLQRSADAKLPAGDASAGVLLAGTKLARDGEPCTLSGSEGAIPARKPGCHNCDWAEKTDYAPHGHAIARCLITGNGHADDWTCADWGLAP
jgi:hypothetical protein